MRDIFPDLDVSYFIEGQINMDQMLDSIYSYDVNEVGLLYFHGSNVRKLPEINICPRTTIKLSVISIITRSSRWKIMESMTGIWLEDISTWAKILHIRSCGR